MSNCGITLTRAIPDLPTPQEEKLVLHNIHSDMVLVCYRSDEDPYSPDSFNMANYYSRLRRIPTSNLLALPCDFHDNILTESQFYTQIHNPILDAITGGSGSAVDSSGLSDIWVIVLSFGIPYVYRNNNGELLSVASSLSRIGHDLNGKHLNHTYDRKDWRFFNANDATELKIVSHLDAPCFEIAKLLVNRSMEMDNIGNITGRIFVDPYGKKETAEQIKYEESILDFVDRDINNFGLKNEITVDLEDPYIEPQIHKLTSDSFYWGWFTDRTSFSIFDESSARRVFLYNADNDGASQLHIPVDINKSDPWCNAAISIEDGYAACSGSVGPTVEDEYSTPPLEDAYLRARPFFESLHRGSSLGEAFLFSSRYVNWKILLIGDPLMTVNFPIDFVPHIPQNKEAISLIKRDIEDGYAWGLRQDQLIENIVNKVVNSNNLSEQLFLLEPILLWQESKNTESQKNLFSRAIGSLMNYVIQSQNITFIEWIHNNNEQISQYVQDLISSRTSSSSEINNEFDIYPQGQWEINFIYNHPNLTLERVNFILEIDDNSFFGSSTIAFNTMDSTFGWQFEKEFYEFFDIPIKGMWSNYSTRRIRFTSPREFYLTTLGMYFYRWKAIDDNGNNLTDWSQANKFIVAR